MLEGVLLLADVSGFTALAEKCVQQNGPERGAEELAHALNTYMGDILEVVLDFGGDILKFAGVSLGGGRVSVVLMRSVSRGSLLDSTLLFAESQGELLCLQHCAGLLQER
ncbi:adenylate cyclase type 10-like [Meleagris gallopavo]|uniref:adenylate cyclase type 10-like n=1 Tax=Meleagris gallopavo TaxID=9103 RepID=UPI00093986F1|nr:adenylate cyclase type 10-like [Meleagris gallopavo]